MNDVVDIEKLATLFQSKYGVMVAAARRYAPTPDQVLDVIQQVFIDFVRNAERRDWDLERDLSPLLYRMVRDRALELRRKQQSKSSETLLEIGRRFAESCRRSDDEESDELEALRHCLERLPPRSREYVRRHYDEGVSIEQLASEESVKANTLRQTFCRIRSTLRKCIENTVTRDP